MMYVRGKSALLRVVCAWAVAAALPSAASAALAGVSSGLSGTLSSNAAIRKQQIICDPDPPDVGSTSVSYNATVSLLAGISDGPGYGPPASGPGGYIQVRTSTGSLELRDLGQYLNDLDEFGRSYITGELGLTETGYVQVLYRRTGTPGQISVPSGYFIVDEDHGVTGTEGIDPFALFFDAAPTEDPNPIGRYTVFAAAANTFSGNAADFFQVNGANPYTVPASQIQPVTVEGPFVPEPSCAALIGLTAAGLLCRRRARRLA